MQKIVAAFAAILTLLGVVSVGTAGAYDSNEVAEVQSWYNGVGLTADSGGLAYWANRYDGHNDIGCGSANLAPVSLDIRSFLAGTNRMTGSNTWKVIYAYRVVLGRYPDNGGLNYWVGRLNSGTAWETMVNTMVYSNEYKSVKIQGTAYDYVPC